MGGMQAVPAIWGLGLLGKRWVCFSWAPNLLFLRRMLLTCYEEKTYMSLSLLYVIIIVNILFLVQWQLHMSSLQYLRF